ncbi:MAG: hypothetical protein LBS28_02045 [Streptococcaceae bacterium]|nr:hypothetical protein [Streptococcaceae bacterium]
MNDLQELKPELKQICTKKVANFAAIANDNCRLRAMNGYLKSLLIEMWKKQCPEENFAEVVQLRTDITNMIPELDLFKLSPQTVSC